MYKSDGNRKGASIWRLNNSHSNDIQFKNKIATIVKQYIKINDNGEGSPLMVWGESKAVIRGEIIAFSSFKKSKKKMK